jgi:hypothetical protein
MNQIATKHTKDTKRLLIFSCLSCVTWLLILASPTRAGLYYSGESIAELPAQWRGFLVDHRTLRSLAIKPAAGLPPSPLLTQYRDALESLEKKKNPGPDDLADLGALHVRLGQPAKAIDILRPAQRQHPDHFRIAANLGTAWQLSGNLDQAAESLRVAVKLAPPKFRSAEELHLKLVKFRQRKDSPQQIDDLFALKFGNDAGRLPEEERKKLSAESVACLQRLALALPADGRLLWQMGELANAYGDVRTAAAIFDGCVTEFGISSTEMRQRRQVVRAAADQLGPAARTDAGKTAHEGHGGLVFRSPRALQRKFDFAGLPAVRDDAANPLPWPVLAETTFDSKSRPTFLDYLKKLDGKSVSLTGFMQPIGDQFEVSEFLLIEYPVGCWFCETPPLTGMVFVELPSGTSLTIKRGLVKIEGKLKLNSTDPEDFLFSLKDARVGEAD